MYWVKLLLLFYVYCQGLCDDPIAQNRAKREAVPLWKQPMGKADDRCGSQLKDNATCNMPRWCPGRVGRCCRKECICKALLNPCDSGKSKHEKNADVAPPVPGHEGECTLECMKKCYKTCPELKTKPDACAVRCAPGCQSRCGGR
ncbi:uncharacterized protein LOC125947177 [Dermacentor silvarum]|uniref:uncharacterized protein LOC125947177 n=1 Tax=Dermacentor silvarum TaxID=543639 RepID=UPI00210075C5|nr:uncharacterized protein LOC125947177 [Dermacentor silvarum]